MKRVFTFLALIVFSAGVSAQRISKVQISSQGGTTDLIAVQTDDAVINLSLDGKIINYGVEYASERNSTYTRVEPYQGRVDLFGSYDDPMFQGKLKYLGKTAITYYASYDLEILRGKVKSIGSLVINYYMQYDEETMRGKIKSMGSSAFDYFSSFDNTALKGKLKTIGVTQLNYYSSYDDKAAAGRIKSIGPVSFTYYSSFDSRYAGAMKTGSQQNNVNGINFFIQ